MVPWCKSLPKNGRNMSDSFKLAQDRRARALRAIGYALTLEDSSVWPDVATVLSCRLSEDELALLALSALHALPDEFAVEIAQRHLTDVGATPDTWLSGSERAAEALAWARDWAKDAAQLDLKVVAMAAVDRMPPRTRQGFRAWLDKSRSAA